MALHAIDSLDGQVVSVEASDKKLEVSNFVWDTDTLSWVRQSQYSSGGPASDVVVVSTPALTDAQLRATPVNVTEAELSQRVEDLDTTLYIGKAAVGSAESSSLWKIKRTTFVGSLIVTEWANGSSSFNNSWDARASYTYS